MMRALKRYISIISVALCCLLPGCDSGYDCSLNNIAYNHVGFYITDVNGIESAYKFPEVLTVSLLVNGRDSIVVNHIQDTDGLTLPVSYTGNCDTLIFSYESGAVDTLYIGHDNIPFYQSMECGVIMHHKLTEIGHTDIFIDSIAIKDATINFDNNENIKIYFIE